MLATAGLVRLGLGHRITQRLEPSIFPYAVGQGALGIEVSEDRPDMLQLARHADHNPSRWRGLAERAMLRSLQGGCSSPIGVSSSFAPQVQDAPGSTNLQACAGKLRLEATVLDLEGKAEVSGQGESLVEDDQGAEQLGVTVAEILVQKGAQSLLVKQ